MLHPHDLVWLKANATPVAEELPEWVSQQWQPRLPLVVRRDIQPEGRIPVGIRGMQRSQRAAAWVAKDDICRVVTPASLVADPLGLLHSPFVSQPQIQALLALIPWQFPWYWGVTGGCGYALATEIPVIHANSDLDLLIHWSHPARAEQVEILVQQLLMLPCRIDVQIATPKGGFALREWLLGGGVMLKTATGPLLTLDPWA